MRVVFLSELYPPHGKGAQIATKRAAEKLASLGISVDIITNKFNGEKDEEHVNNVRIHRRKLFPEKLRVINYESFLNLHSEAIIKELINDGIIGGILHKATVIHVADLWFCAIPALKNLLNIPVVITLNSYAHVCYYVSTAKYYNYKAVCKECKLQRCILKNNMSGLKILKGERLVRALGTPLEVLYAKSKMHRYIYSLMQADAIIVPSYYSKKHTLRLIPGKYTSNLESKIIVIPPVIPDDIPIVPYEGGKESLSLIYMGGPDISKGYLNLLAVMPYVVRRNPKIRLFMAMTDNDPLALEFVRKYGLKDNVFLLPRLNDSEKYRLFKEIDALVAPSVWPETFLQVAIEANLMGRVAIVPQIGAAREYIVDGVNGFLVNSFSLSSLAGKILEISRLSKEMIISMGINARKLALNKFNSRQIINLYIDLYTKLSKNRGNM
jgi:glycosyltransferase involved in cell wall biosynthesis